MPTGAGAFKTLELGPGERYAVREDLAPRRRRPRRAPRSLAYFGQLSDFQLADEESPARVEFLDPPNGNQFPFDAAWRPWEALEPQIDDAAIRQLDQFAPASPIAQGNGSRRTMDFALDTGDSADSQQLNETRVGADAARGRARSNPNSGINPIGLPAPALPARRRPRRRRGRPATPASRTSTTTSRGPSPPSTTRTTSRGYFAGLARLPGPDGPRPAALHGGRASAVPTYVAFGNHDGLVQGNQAANGAFEAGRDRLHQAAGARRPARTTSPDVLELASPRRTCWPS